MSVKKCILGIGLTIFLVLQAVSANIETNEVNDGVEYYMLQGVRVYPNDRHCALVGGLCVQSSDCTEPTTNKGLCPSSSHLGAECCYEYKPKLPYR
ncbi:uncharacterized protein LOC115628609 isoform X2 [Scaptodrosophila lebanonensis]|uniref:Uncharacterized protein LOC115628609 isoform X2 n=1 Tax=Drosophila lebanonensis TaxID=7225 RepID=A0A6J2TX08_DROLE|nr:uncharacterized protein LOC115628609 isoform X2 [Scaptodrosophila lebanonensis]